MVMTAVSAIITSTGLLAYDHFVTQPTRRLGVVDIAAIYRAKEDEYTRAFYKAAANPATQGSVSGPAQVAQDFVQRLPYALNDLRRECRCVIVVRSAVAALGDGMVDLTPALRGKLGMQP